MFCEQYYSTQGLFIKFISLLIVAQIVRRLWENFTIETN
jgi:hypothetical protein